MSLSHRPSPPGWVLSVPLREKFSSTLVYDFGDGLSLEKALTPAYSSLLQALAACRALDERAGITRKVGARSLEELGRLVRLMRGPRNEIAANTIGDYKRAITRLVEAELRALSLKTGRALHLPMPLYNEGYAEGYRLADGGLRLSGISLDELVRVVGDEEASRTHGISHGFPPH